MIRIRHGLLSLAIACAFTVFACAEEKPLAVDPADLSAPDRAVLLGELAEIETFLSAEMPIQRSTLIRRGWTDYEFALYLHGFLQTNGRSSVVVWSTGSDGANRYWVLVRVPLLHDDAVAWVPVNVGVSVSGEWWNSVGQIPWVVEGATYQDAFMSYSEILELPVNRAPTAQLLLRDNPVIDIGYKLLVNGRDSDGQILAYEWKIDGATVSIGVSPAFSYTFAEARTHSISVTAIDNRGAQATSEGELRVIAEDPGCGCGG